MAYLDLTQQKGVYDCGLYVITAAILVAAGEDVGQVSFDQTVMRAHLAKCYEMKQLSPFPTVRKNTDKNKVSNVFIRISC